MVSKWMGIIAATLWVWGLVTPAPSQAATAREMVETQVNKVLKTLAEPGFKDHTKDAKIDKIRSLVRDPETAELSRQPPAERFHLSTVEAWGSRSF